MLLCICPTREKSLSSILGHTLAVYQWRPAEQSCLFSIPASWFTRWPAWKCFAFLCLLYLFHQSPGMKEYEGITGFISTFILVLWYLTLASPLLSSPFPCHTSFAFLLQSSAVTDDAKPLTHHPHRSTDPGFSHAHSLSFSLNTITSPVYTRILTFPKHATLAAEFLSVYLFSYFLHISKENQIRMGQPINYLDAYCVPNSESRTKVTETNMTDEGIL